MVGGRLRVAIPEGNARTVDKVIGAMAGVLGVLVLLWLTLPTMANVPGWPAEQARNSSVARALNAVLPEPPDTFATLDEFIGDDRFPSVFDALRPSPDLGNPPRRTGIPPTLSEQVAQSTVRIEGEACGRLQEGSGFVVDTDLVVTNAHVVVRRRDDRGRPHRRLPGGSHRRHLRPRPRPGPARGPGPGPPRPADG